MDTNQNDCKNCDEFKRCMRCKSDQEVSNYKPYYSMAGVGLIVLLNFALGIAGGIVGLGRQNGKVLGILAIILGIFLPPFGILLGIPCFFLQEKVPLAGMIPVATTLPA